MERIAVTVFAKPLAFLMFGILWKMNGMINTAFFCCTTVVAAAAITYSWVQTSNNASEIFFIYNLTQLYYELSEQ